MRVRVRRPSAPRNGHKLSGPLHRSLQIKATATRSTSAPRTPALSLTPLPVHPNRRMPVRDKSTQRGIQAGRHCSRALVMWGETWWAHPVCETSSRAHTPDAFSRYSFHVRCQQRTVVRVPFVPALASGPEQRDRWSRASNGSAPTTRPSGQRAPSGQRTLHVIWHPPRTSAPAPPCH
jgi:hypothetical protein